MGVEADDILDPAHEPDGGTNVGAAGIPPPAGSDGEAKVTPDGNVLEHGGVKYVRQEALHNERQQAKELRDTLARLDPLMPEFQEFLTQRNNRQSATVSRNAAVSDGDYSNDELDGLAIVRGYYADDGRTPDRARAKQELDILSRVSDRRTEKRVAPLERGTASDRAAANRARAHSSNFVDGQPIAEEKYMTAALGALPDEYVADPNIANITQVIAAGLEYLDKRKNGTLSRGRRGGREPMMVENGTGRFEGDDGELSQLDIAAARARGKSPAEWAKMSKTINKGRSGVLEDV